jgi:putative transcriptional regulator
MPPQSAENRTARRSSAARARPLRARLEAALTAALLLPLLLCAAAPLRAQTVRDGALLVAQESMRDPNFTRSVVLILRHDEQGTLGLVINRVTTLEPGQVFEELAEPLGEYAGPLYRGGPVQASRVIFLVRGIAAAVVEGPEIVDKVFLSANAEALPEIAALAEGESSLRLYAGHVEWQAGELEREIGAGNWRVVQGSGDLVFHPDPSALWDAAAQLASGDLIAATGP